MLDEATQPLEWAASENVGVTHTVARLSATSTWEGGMHPFNNAKEAFILFLSKRL